MTKQKPSFTAIMKEELGSGNTSADDIPEMVGKMPAVSSDPSVIIGSTSHILHARPSLIPPNVSRNISPVLQEHSAPITSKVVEGLSDISFAPKIHQGAKSPERLYKVSANICFDQNELIEDLVRDLKKLKREGVEIVEASSSGIIRHALMLYLPNLKAVIDNYMNREG